MRSSTLRARRVRSLVFVGVAAGAATIGLAPATREAAAGGGRDPAPRLTAHDEARIELGRRLFFDPQASRAGMRSCADCHDPEHGFSDRERKSRDDRGPTKRHSQTLIDGADNPSAHWDGVFSRVEDLVTARVTMSMRGRFSNGHEFSPANSRLGLASPSEIGRSAGATNGPIVEPTKIPEFPKDGPVGYDGSTTPSSESGDSGMTDEQPSRGNDCPDRYREPNSAGGEREPAAAPPTTTPSEKAPTPEATAPAPSSSGGVAPKAPDAGKGAPSPGAAAGPKDAAKSAADPYTDPFAATARDPDEDLQFLDPELKTADLPLADQALEATDRYREAFTAAFGTPQVTIKKIAEAIEAYCRSIHSGESAYDRYVAGDRTALSDPAQRGLVLFEGRAGCAQCHLSTAPSGRRAPFTDYQFHDTGVSWHALGASGLMDDATRLSIADRDADLGAAGATGRAKMRRAFKTPTLRDVARRGPFMHDGSVPTLDAAVRHYERGTTDPAADAKMPRLAAGLSDGERADLVAFLRSLTGAERPGLASTAWRDRAPQTRLRLVDAAGKPLAYTRLKVVPAGDRLPGADARDADGEVEMTDEAGVIEFAPPLWTHVRLVLADGLTPLGGSLVPDTCRETTVTAPVAGKTRVLVTMPKGVEAPTALVAEHIEARVFPDRARPRTVLRRESAMAVGDRVIALYSAAMRTDVPPRVSLRLPVKTWGMDRLRVTLDGKDDVRLDLSK